MKIFRYLLIIILFMILLPSCNFLAKRYEKVVSETLTVSVTGKDAVFLKNTNGDIKIHKSSDSLITVKVKHTLYLKKKDLNEDIDWININLDTLGKIIQIEISNLREFRFFNIGNTPDSDIDIYIPERLFVNVDNTNGDLEADNISNDIKADIVNGKISLMAISGNIEAELTNGNIKAFLDTLKDCNLKVTNGKVTIKLNDNTTGIFDLTVKNGKITTGDIKFDSTEVNEKGYLRAKIGNTGNRITVKVTNGKIILEKEKKHSTVKKNES